MIFIVFFSFHEPLKTFIFTSTAKERRAAYYPRVKQSSKFVYFVLMAILSKAVLCLVTF